MDPHLKADIIIQAIGVAFFAGVYWMTSRENSEKIGELRKDVNVHDREIGALYGHNDWPREVRR